jgi:hypothetical protein
MHFKIITLFLAMTSIFHTRTFSADLVRDGSTGSKSAFVRAAPLTEAPNPQAFDDIIEIDLDGKDIITHIPNFIEQGLIPGMNAINLFVKDSTSDAAGQNKQQIILIGKNMPNGKPKIIYILKKISVGNNRDFSGNIKNEISGIKSAYQNWNKDKTKNRLDFGINATVLNQGGTSKIYKLKLAWHERIFHDRSNPKVYYELLHAAQGKLMETYVKMPIIYSKYFNSETKEPVLDAELKVDIAYRTVIYDSEIEDELYEHITKNISGIEDFNQMVVDRKLDQNKGFVKHLRAFFEKYRVASSGKTLKFTENCAVLVETDWEKTRIAYEALGAVVGGLFKKHNLDLGTKALDLHHNNIFFNELTNTITWIDLEMLGDHLSGGLPGRESTLVYALKDKLLSTFLNEFHNGARIFYPDADEHTIRLLKQERNRLFNNIRELYESFADAFIQNYNPSDAQRIKAYFKEKFIYPYNDNPRWQVPSPSDKLAFCKLER